VTDAPNKIRLDSWRWGSAFFAVFLVLVFAWGIGIPIRRVFLEGSPTTLHWISLGTGAVAAISFLALSVRAVLEFFLSVRVGVAVLVYFLLGSTAAVVVHPREPDKYLDPRVPIEQREEKHYEDFAWATSYFLYHCQHPYGIGMPNYPVPVQAQKTLERIGARYGPRIARQEESGMKTATNGSIKTGQIRKFMENNESWLRALYRFCTFSQLNGTATGKGAWSSDWFTALMGLLGIVVFTNTFRRGAAKAAAEAGRSGDPALGGFLRRLPGAMAADAKTLIGLERIGFSLSHLGVLTALVGGLYSRANEQRGIAQLSTDPADRLHNKWFQESYQFSLYSGRPHYFGTDNEPEFAVRLANFRADYRDVLDLEFIDDPKPKTLPTYRFFEIWKGRQIGLNYAPMHGMEEKGSSKSLASLLSGEPEPKTVVRVLEHWPRANVRFELRAREEGEPAKHALEEQGPAVRLGIEQTSMQMAFSQLMFAGDADLHTLDQVPGIRVRLEGARNAAEQRERCLAPFEGERFGTLEIYTETDTPEEPTRLVGSGDVRVGETFNIEAHGGKSQFKITRALNDAREMPRPDGSFVRPYESMPQEVVAPTAVGAFVEITSPDGKRGALWITDGMTGARPEDALYLGGKRYWVVVHADPWRSPARERYRLVVAPGLPAMLAHVGTREEPTAMEPGANATLVGGLTLKLEERADRPSIVPRIDPIPGDPDDDQHFFDASRPPAVKVEVQGEKGREEFVLAATTLADSALAQGNLRIRLFENRADMPREWKSKLEFLDLVDGKWVPRPDATTTIRVNDYAFYRGYRFFQTDANAKFPGYSGVGVVFDPGIEWAMGGMWLIVLGVAYAFLLKPLLLRSTVR